MPDSDNELSTDSPFMDTTTTSTTEEPKSDDQSKNKYITYILAAIVVSLVLYLLYYSYTCFCENQAIELSEPFIEKTVKTGIDSDKSFDIDVEVNKLSERQEEYLKQINNSS